MTSCQWAKDIPREPLEILFNGAHKVSIISPSTCFAPGIKLGEYWGRQESWWPWIWNRPIPVRRMRELGCNGHYNCTPDLGKGGMWWNVWDLARYSILDAKVLDRDVTWLTKHKDTSWYEHKVWRHLAPLVVMDTDKAFWQANDRRRVRKQ